MKIKLLLLVGFCCIISSNTRLIEKITDRTLTTETKPGSSQTVRLPRAAQDSHEEEALTGISDRDEQIHSHEFAHAYGRKVREFGMQKPDNYELLRVVRKPKDSSERFERSTKNVTLTSPSASSPAVHIRAKPKERPALVKKPIPKYNDMDYDDDFQMKMNKSPVKLIDSGEHEDEDFNLNDYDFDVNHDEFVGRGRPLEPRIKHKDNQIESEAARQPKPAVAPEIKIKSKVNIASARRTGSNKRERSAEINKKTGDKDDYYDETPTTKVTEKARDLEDDFNEENEESKEYDSKGSTVRLARSPWKINSVADKLGEKVSTLSKTLSILPMFPQFPGKVRDNDISNDQSDAWYSKRLKD